MKNFKESCYKTILKIGYCIFTLDFQHEFDDQHSYVSKLIQITLKSTKGSNPKHPGLPKYRI